MIHLPNPLAKNPVGGSHLFFVIILSEQYVSSALWGVVEGQLQIVQRSEDHAWQDDESCINAVDQSLQELGKDSENVSQTLFALPSDWVDPAGIAVPKKRLFQKMTKDLSLEPIGFVVTTEAMTQFLTKTAPQLNIFVVEVGVPYMTVALVKAGQITKTVKVGRSGESVSDFREALAHLGEQTLPSKIELYSPTLSQEELNEVQQQLIGFEWKESYPFLHPPVIEVFEAIAFVDVVIKTGGAALAISKGLLSAEAGQVEPVPMMTSSEIAELSGNGAAGIATGVTTTDTTTAMATATDVLPQDAPLFGGTSEEAEVTKSSQLNEMSESNEPSNLEPVSAAEMGFATATLAANHPQPADIQSTDIQSTNELPIAVSPELAIEPPARTAQPITSSQRATSFAHSPSLKGTALATDEPDEGLSTHRHQSTHHSLGAVLKAHLLYIVIGVIAGVAVLVMSIFIANQTMLKAKVLLTLQTQHVSKDITLTLDPQVAASDPTKLVLKATSVMQNEQGQKTATTTGTKIIGDKATGMVTLYNYTASSQTFGAGTKLSTGNLNFVLDQAATLASASSSLDSSNNLVTKPGTRDAAVTASAIGTDSNIAAATNLTVGGFAKETYAAFSKGAFVGGTSREIQAVSPQDRTQLLASLQKDLVAKAVQDEKVASGNGQSAVPTNRVKVITATYNADVGKEVNSLSLNLTLQVEFLQYSAADLQPLAQQVLASQVPAGYQLVATPPEVMSIPIATATTSAQVKLQTSLSTTTEPQINLDDFKSQIAGKSEQAALKILAANPAITSAQIEFVPKLLGMIFHTLPSETKITVVKQE